MTAIITIAMMMTLIGATTAAVITPIRTLLGIILLFPVVFTSACAADE
jgi:ATP/ADP translocase